MGIEDQRSLHVVIAEFRQRNDWQAIRNLVPIDNLRTQRSLWDDPKTLSEIAFACAKLSETSSNDLRGLRSDRARLEQFLKQQAVYRSESELLRERCIALAPDRPGYRSDLAYLHFQNAQELTQPGGRRDGNARDEATRALELYEEALRIQPERIQDLYRAGYLLAELKPRLAKTAARHAGDLAAANLQREREGGMSFLSRAIATWEALPATSEYRRRYRKEYVKALYHAGKCRYEMLYSDWDDAIYALEIETLDAPSRARTNDVQLANAREASRLFAQCWAYDRDTEPAAGSNPPFDGVYEAVEKLYWLGKVKFAEYWILSHGGTHTSQTASTAREQALKCYERALSTPRSSANARKHKKLRGRETRASVHHLRRVRQGFRGDRAALRATRPPRPVHNQHAWYVLR